MNSIENMSDKLKKKRQEVKRLYNKVASKVLDYNLDMRPEKYYIDLTISTGLNGVEFRVNDIKQDFARIESIDLISISLHKGLGLVEYMYNAQLEQLETMCDKINKMNALADRYIKEEIKYQKNERV